MSSKTLALAAATIAFAALLAACQKQAPAKTSTEPAGSGGTEVPGPLATATENPAGRTGTGPENTTPGTNGMDKSCEGVTFRIVHDDVGESDNKATATTLQRIGSDGTANRVEKPEEMAGYTAVGLACAVATSDSRPYFVVQYGELPFGCEFCEWFYLYDADGKQLTSSKPPILSDAALPEDRQQTANTREYEEAIKTLGITQPEIAYVR